MNKNCQQVTQLNILSNKWNGFPFQYFIELMAILLLFKRAKASGGSKIDVTDTVQRIINGEVNS